MIIGGASIYTEFLEYADKMYLTHIDAYCSDAEVYFPKFDIDDWDVEKVGDNIDNGISYKHVLYRRKRENG